MPRTAATSVPPGPARRLPLLGHAAGLLRDPLGFLSGLARDHGDAARFELAGSEVYLFNHPDAIEEVLLTKAPLLTKDDYTRRLSLVVGNGLLTSEGDVWRRQRKLAQPAFHHQRVRAYADTMVRHAARYAASLRDGESRDVHADMMRLTLDIVAETLFGADVGDAASEIGYAMEIFSERFAGLDSLIPLWVPTLANLRARRALARLDTLVYRLIRAGRNREDRGDLLSMLLRATTDEGGGMSERQLRDEVVTLLLAGHETTALAVTYALHSLGTHADAAATLDGELSRVLGGRPATAADLASLGCADAVVRETLRLYPPVWAIAREAREPCTIGGYEVARGTQLWVAEWLVQRDARFFPDPDRFLPERWNGELARRLPRFAYFPFGGGPRVCIGNAFATMEAVLVLVTVLQAARLTPARPLAFNPSVTLRPAGPVIMRVARRSRGDADTA